jgi:hypothetical protein
MNSIVTKFFAQNVNGLDSDDLRYATPAVFAKEAHESRTARYTYIPTSEILAELYDQGFVPTTAMQSRSRDEAMEEYTKHLIRLRKVSDLGFSKPDVHEIVLVNNHNGGGAYQLHSGAFRLVCLNGVIAGDEHSFITARHQGNVVDNVIESTLKIAEESEGVMEQIQEMKSIMLSTPEKNLFATYALKARFNLDDDDEEESKKQAKKQAVIPYTPEDFLRPNRYDDGGNDLYHIFHTVQENMIKGVRHYERGRRKKARQVNGIAQSTKANQLLWGFAQELKKIHGK